VVQQKQVIAGLQLIQQNYNISDSYYGLNPFRHRAIYLKVK